MHKARAGVQTLPIAAAHAYAAQIVHLFLHIMAALTGAVPVKAKANKRAQVSLNASKFASVY